MFGISCEEMSDDTREAETADERDLCNAARDNQCGDVKAFLKKGVDPNVRKVRGTECQIVRQRERRREREE